MQLKNAERGEINPSPLHANWLLSNKWSDPKTCVISNITQTEQVLLSNIYVYACIYIHVATIIEKGYKFDRGQRAYGRVWSKEREK